MEEERWAEKRIQKREYRKENTEKNMKFLVKELQKEWDVSKQTRHTVTISVKDAGRIWIKVQQQIADMGEVLRMQPYMRYVFDISDTGGKKTELTWNLDGDKLGEFMDYQTIHGKYPKYERLTREDSLIVLKDFTKQEIGVIIVIIKEEFAERMAGLSTENRPPDNVSHTKLAGGSNLLLIDEDKSATNFMIRDINMRKIVEHEPIIPFTDRICELYSRCDVSTILVIRYLILQKLNQPFLYFQTVETENEEKLLLINIMLILLF